MIGSVQYALPSFLSLAERGPLKSASITCPSHNGAEGAVFIAADTAHLPEIIDYSGRLENSLMWKPHRC